MLLGLTACGSATVWDIPTEVFRARLMGGSHGFLRHIDYKAVDAREASRLGPEAPYYLAVIFRSMAMPDMERRMLELGCRSAPGVVREECEVALARLLLDHGRPEEALRRIGSALRWISDAERAAALRRARVEALFSLGRDEELLDALDPEDSRDDPDLTFYRAASSARRKRAGWEEGFRSLAWGHRSTEAHSWAAAFIEADPGRAAALGGADVGILRGKAALAQGRTEAGAALLRESLRSVSIRPGSGVVEELARAYLKLDRYAEGVAALEEIRPATTEPWVVDEFEGRLLRAGGSPSLAAQALEKSFRASPDSAQRQRALWHYLDLRLAGGEKNLGTLFHNRREFITDASYFEDLLEEAVTALLAERSWRELELLRDFARDRHAAPTIARADFILARAVSARLLEATPSRDPGALLDEAIDADPMSYYALVASCLRGRSYARLDVAPDPGGPSSSVTSRAATEDFGDTEGFVSGFFLYGLALDGYRAALAAGSGIAEPAVLEAARDLQSFGHSAESIRLVAARFRGETARATRRRLLLLYPALYISDVERTASERDIPVAVALGLVREESLFDPDIVSRAGAVGLTQLMPSTAEEVAARLGESDPELTDPLTNLRLGLRHLAGLRANTGSLARAVMAYNAGLSRLRGWEREQGRLPDELFAEVLPYAETRLYVRQVLVSAVMYGALYEQATPAETVDLFFPALIVPRTP